MISLYPPDIKRPRRGGVIKNYEARENHRRPVKGCEGIEDKGTMPGAMACVHTQGS